MFHPCVGLHSFNGPERNFRPLGAPTNPGRRPVASGRKWAIHREYKPERGAHTKVQYNGMKYQKGLKPPPRQLLQEGRRPMTTGFVPRVKTRPATQQASRNFHKLFGGKLERHTSHGRRSKSSSSPRRGRSVKVVSPRQKRATTVRHKMRVAAVVHGTHVTHRFATCPPKMATVNVQSPTRRTMSVGVGVLGFDDRSSMCHTAAG